MTPNTDCQWVGAGPKQNIMTQSFDVFEAGRLFLAQGLLIP